jgi:hypothetical protein
MVNLPNHCHQLNRRPRVSRSRAGSGDEELDICPAGNRSHATRFVASNSNERPMMVEAPYYKRKAAGSISDVVNGFFNLPNPSNRAMALGSTQLLTEMSTSNCLE